jgi:hypothetical protein
MIRVHQYGAWSSVADAIENGKTASLKRVDRGLPEMERYLDIIARHCRDIPIGILLVKGAFESRGNPTAVSKAGEIGLFQLKPGHAKDFGFSRQDLKDPYNNTIAAVNLLQKRSESFQETHGSWFPQGRNWQFWGVQLLATMIGPGATRYLLNQIPSGQKSFSRLVKFVETHPEWMEKPEQNRKWGAQSGRLVAFRVMIARRLWKRAQELEETGYRIHRIPDDSKAPWWVIPVTGVALACEVALIAVSIFAPRWTGCRR